MSDHSSRRKVAALPRVPMAGNIDLTYRCNNNCCHCWLHIPPDSPEEKEELTSTEVQDLVEAARAMGCRKWSISGGEPMLRPDFEVIFDQITRRAGAYTLNTNGTLITPRIARLMKRKGSKLIALYGATASVHDGITRNPGSFEAMMRGVAYLKEAGAGFTVQVIPMRDNYCQYEDMVHLAESLSRSWRVGAPWLWLSASGEPGKNLEITDQRLDPAEVVKLDEPDLSFEEWVDGNVEGTCRKEPGDERLFAACIRNRRDFHVDPYGKMSFCCFVKDPALRYDLRTGSFRDAWEKFVPSLSSKVRAGREYFENCGACESARIADGVQSLASWSIGTIRPRWNTFAELPGKIGDSRRSGKKSIGGIMRSLGSRFGSNQTFPSVRGHLGLNLSYSRSLKPARTLSPYATTFPFRT